MCVKEKVDLSAGGGLIGGEMRYDKRRRTISHLVYHRARDLDLFYSISA